MSSNTEIACDIINHIFAFLAVADPSEPSLKLLKRFITQPRY